MELNYIVGLSEPG